MLLQTLHQSQADLSKDNNYYRGSMVTNNVTQSTWVWEHLRWGGVPFWEGLLWFRLCRIIAFQVLCIWMFPRVILRFTTNSVLSLSLVSTAPTGFISPVTALLLETRHSNQVIAEVGVGVGVGAQILMLEYILIKIFPFLLLTWNFTPVYLLS